MGQIFPWNISQILSWNTDDSRSDQGDEGIDTRTQSANDATRNTENMLNSLYPGNFVNMLYSCYKYHSNLQIEEDDLYSWTPWNVTRHFDNKLSSHVTLFESGYSFHKFEVINKVSKLFQLENKWSLQPKTVLLVGSSGIGKTTLCAEIANQWGKKEILHDTKCLFLINLDDSAIQKISRLEDLACYSFKKFHPELSNQHVREFLENDNSDITIIIDGFKEPDHENNAFLTRLIQRRILRQCRLIITVHPLALERVQKIVDISLNVEILGFTENGINVCIQQELQEHANKITVLRSYLDENKYVKNLCHVPTLLMILIQFVKKNSLSNIGMDHWFEQAIFRFVCASSYQEESDITHILYLSKLAFESFRNRESCNFGCLCVQEYLAGHYIANLTNPCEQFDLLKKFLFKSDLIGTWAQLNLGSIVNFDSHSIFCHIEVKGSMSSLPRFHSLYGFLDQFSHEDFQICSKIIFQAIYFVHSEEKYYERHEIILKDWYYNDREYDKNLYNLFCWNKVYLSLRDACNSDCRGIELILFHKYMPDLSFYKAIRQLLQKQHIAVMLRNSNALLGYRASSCQLTEGLALTYLLNALILKFCHITCDIICHLNVEYLESLLISDCKWSDVNVSITSILQMLKKTCTLKYLNLSCNNLPGEVAKDLAEIIHSNTSITALYLANNKLHSMGGIVLQALKDVSTLKVLDLDNNNMTGEISEELAGVIKCNPYLEELHLSGNDLQSSATVILHALQQHSKLKLLNLNENKIPDTIGEEMALVIKCNISLQDLRLGFNNLKSSVIPILLALKEFKLRLKVLNLNGIGMSGEVAVLVADVICNFSPVDLQLCSNSLHSSATVIMQALQEAYFLRILNLNNNNISEQAAQHLVNVIERNYRYLEDLRLSSNNLQSSACLILEALKRKPKSRKALFLKILNLNNNNMSAKVTELLSDVIRENYLLEELHLSNNNFQQSAVVFLKAMKSLSRLKVLNLNGNKMSGKVAQDLAHVIENNRYHLQGLHLGFNNMRSSLSLVLQSLETISHLKILNLSGNYMTDSVAQKLANVIKANVNLEVLRVSCNDFRDLKSSVWFILRALQGISNLKILDMSNNNLSCDGEIVIKDLAGVINSNSCLEELRLSGNRLQLCSSDFVVLQAMERISSLKRLNLNCNKLSGGETGEHIAHVIANNTRIEELSLSHNYLSSSLVSILRSLSKVSHLKKLNLNCNSISGIDAAEDLATVIANNTCLEELCLGNNNFYSSAVTILQALQNINGLKVLDLSSNNVSENAGELLANVLKSNAHLKDLRLSFNKLGSSDIVIIQALQNISTLRILCLSGNYMSEKTGKDLAAAIENNKNIEDLRLSNNNFQTSISLILESLATTMHLKVLHLSNNSITGSDAITLALVIENNVSLEEVCLPSNGFHLSADKIVLALKKLCKLKKLNLNDNYMSSSVSSDLADVIANNSSLSDLLISKNNLQSSALVIFEALIRTSALRKLNLNNNGLSGSVAQGLAHVVDNNPYLEELHLSNNALRSSVKIVLKSLQSLSKLKVLNLNKISITNIMSQDIPKCLGEVITSNSYLEELHLSECNFRSSSAKFLEAMKGISRLRKLNLNSNNMTGEVAEVLADAIVHNASLEELFLSNNNFNTSAIVILQAVARLTKLKKLNLNNNAMSGVVAEQFADIIRCNTRLEELFLSNNNLNSSTILILQALKGNSKLKALDLRCNNISEDVVEDLVKFIHHNNTLVHLNLDSNNLQMYAHKMKGNSKLKITL